MTVPPVQQINMRRFYGLAGKTILFALLMALVAASPVLANIPGDSHAASPTAD